MNPQQSSIYQQVGEELRRARIQSFDGSRSELSEKLGIKSPNLSAYESGKKSLSILKLDEIARFYGKRVQIRLIGSSSVEERVFVVMFGGMIYGVGKEDHNAWREAEMGLNINRETLADMGYYLSAATVTRD